jgi:hypothetical protein
MRGFSKSVLHTELSSRCQVDLTDLQIKSNGDKKFIMVYQNNLTKFLLFCISQTKRTEVACHLAVYFKHKCAMYFTFSLST